MSKRPFMPLYIADYLRDTRTLSLEAHGAYLLLLMEYWTHGKLPADDKTLCKIIGADRYEWSRIKPQLRAYFVGSGQLMLQKRIESELARSAEISNKRKAAALQKHSKSRAIASDLHPQLIKKEDKLPLELSQSGPKPPQPNGGSLATALPTGALASPPSSVPPDRWQQRPANSLTNEELRALYRKSNP
jgi:uncharacterized protein YdaU (DUF1376 family)